MSWIAIGVTVVGAVGSAAAGQQKAPKKITPQHIDAGDAVSQSLAINNNNFDKEAALSTRTNTYNQSEATRLMNQAIPGFTAMQTKMMAAASSDMDSSVSGNMPPAMQANLARLAAEKGISRGTSGGFNQFSGLRDFGVNMLDWANASRARALSTMSSVYGMAPKVSPMSPMSMFVTPETTLNVQRYNEDSRFNAETAQENAATAAHNYNRQLWAGAIKTSASAIAGGFSGGGAAAGGSAFSASNQASVASAAHTFNSGGNAFGDLSFCWVAREVYGVENPEWKQFRTAMLERMDPDFIAFYKSNGVSIAEQIKDQPEVKQFIRGLMDQIKK